MLVNTFRKAFGVLVVVITILCFVFLNSPEHFATVTLPRTEQLFSSFGHSDPSEIVLRETVDVNSLYAKRRHHVERVCQAHADQYIHIGDVNKRLEAGGFIVDTRHRLVYCPVPKIGCSFWKRVFSIIDGKHQSSYLFNLSSSKIHLQRAYDSFSNKHFLQKYYFLSTSTKFMFVRDPYEKLFSGYIDKIFTPNRVMSTLSKQITANVPDNSSGPGEGHQQDPCPAGLGVTFEKFLRYVVADVHVNKHFKLAYVNCFPCHVQYDVIGKMETFQEDAEYILRTAGLEPADVFGSGSTFGEDNDVSIMRDVVKRTLACLPGCRGCLSAWQVWRRVWTTFQVRGYLSVNVTFPLSREQAEKVKADEMLLLVKGAYSRSGDRSATQRQRQAALLEAFHAVPRALLQDLEVHVKADCELFDYDCSVDTRFNVSHRPEPLFRLDTL